MPILSFNDTTSMFYSEDIGSMPMKYFTEPVFQGNPDLNNLPKMLDKFSAKAS